MTAYERIDGKGTAAQPNGLVIVGNRGGTNVGPSLERAAIQAGVPTYFFDARAGFGGPKLLRALSWRVCGRRPSTLVSASRQLVAMCRARRPRWLICTGISPVDGRALDELGRLGIRRLNYLTDDPWNPSFRSRWFLEALRNYDHVFSPRRANLDDLQRHPCHAVSYLPFAVDPELIFRHAPADDEAVRYAADVVFVGGAERERVAYIAALIRAGFRVALYGTAWDRYPETRAHTRGQAQLEAMRKATSAASVALCLVRRANRDGHVMRSFEIPAVGTCMLAEDTSEHRALFGREGASVLYFVTPQDMVQKLGWLLQHPTERARLGATAQQLVLYGPHTYSHRLETMLTAAETTDRCPR